MTLNAIAQFDDSDRCRILMYSHDTFGLGHLTRTLRIAEAIQRRYEHTSILILTGSPVAPYLPLPPRTDMVKLPSVLKSGADHYEPRDLKLDFKQVRAMRREMIRGTAETFRPHVFIVDNVPLGMKGEIVPTLEMLRRDQPEARTVLNLRDILDAPETIRASWEEHGVPAALESFYDAIYVLGDEEVFDSIEAYGLPRDRTRFVGYATPGPRVSATCAESSARRVLVTAGGGGDGFELIRAALLGLSRIDASAVGGPVEIEVITGPLMDAEPRRELMELAERVGAEIHEFVGDLPRRMETADLVIAMAGYNTCCELLAHASRALLYPRTDPRVEQLLRAEAFVKRGLAMMLPPETPNPDTIRAMATKALQNGARLDPSALPRLQGPERIAEDLARFFAIGHPHPVRTIAETRARSQAGGASDVSAMARAGERFERVFLNGLRSGLPFLDPGIVPMWPGSVLRP